MVASQKPLSCSLSIFYSCVAAAAAVRTGQFYEQLTLLACAVLALLRLFVTSTKPKSLIAIANLGILTTLGFIAAANKLHLPFLSEIRDKLATFYVYPVQSFVAISESFIAATNFPKWLVFLVVELYCLTFCASLRVLDSSTFWYVQVLILHSTSILPILAIWKYSCVNSATETGRKVSGQGSSQSSGLSEDDSPRNDLKIPPYVSGLGQRHKVTIKIHGDVHAYHLASDGLEGLQRHVQDLMSRSGLQARVMDVAVRSGCILISMDVIHTGTDLDHQAAQLERDCKATLPAILKKLGLDKHLSGFEGSKNSLSVTLHVDGIQVAASVWDSASKKLLPTSGEENALGSHVHDTGRATYRLGCVTVVSAQEMVSKTAQPGQAPSTSGVASSSSLNASGSPSPLSCEGAYEADAPVCVFKLLVHLAELGNVGHGSNTIRIVGSTPSSLSSKRLQDVQRGPKIGVPKASSEVSSGEVPDEGLLAHTLWPVGPQGHAQAPTPQPTRDSSAARDVLELWALGPQGYVSAALSSVQPVTRVDAGGVYEGRQYTLEVEVTLGGQDCACHHTGGPAAIIQPLCIQLWQGCKLHTKTCAIIDMSATTVQDTCTWLGAPQDVCIAAARELQGKAAQLVLDGAHCSGQATSNHVTLQQDVHDWLYIVRNLACESRWCRQSGNAANSLRVAGKVGAATAREFAEGMLDHDVFSGLPDVREMIAAQLHNIVQPAAQSISSCSMVHNPATQVRAALHRCVPDCMQWVLNIKQAVFGFSCPDCEALCRQEAIHRLSQARCAISCAMGVSCMVGVAREADALYKPVAYCVVLWGALQAYMSARKTSGLSVAISTWIVRVATNAAIAMQLFDMLSSVRRQFKAGTYIGLYIACALADRLQVGYRIPAQVLFFMAWVEMITVCTVCDPSFPWYMGLTAAVTGCVAAPVLSDAYLRTWLLSGAVVVSETP